MGYSKQVYDRAWQTLARRRRMARDTAEARRREIHAAIPEIARIEREMARGAADITKTVICDPQRAEERIEELARQNLLLQQRRARLLEERGYRADYLEEQYTCPVCRDSGYVGVEMCACMRQLLQLEAGAQLSEVSQFGRSGFDNFSLEYYADSATDETGVIPRRRMEEIFRFCRQYAANFAAGAESLLMIGRTGLGKTHLSLAVGGEVTRRGFGVVYTPVQRMLDQLESEKFSRAAGSQEQYADLVRRYLECDLLVLDDLGTEFASQFTQSVLYNIVNSRLVEERPTIINTNLEVPEIEAKYSQRMVSRLICGYRVLKFLGKDIRYMKKVGQSTGGVKQSL